MCPLRLLLSWGSLSSHSTPYSAAILLSPELTFPYLYSCASLHTMSHRACPTPGVSIHFLSAYPGAQSTPANTSAKSTTLTVWALGIKWLGAFVPNISLGETFAKTDALGGCSENLGQENQRQKDGKSSFAAGNVFTDIRGQPASPSTPCLERILEGLEITKFNFSFLSQPKLWLQSSAATGCKWGALHQGSDPSSTCHLGKTISPAYRQGRAWYIDLLNPEGT